MPQGHDGVGSFSLDYPTFSLGSRLALCLRERMQEDVTMDTRNKRSGSVGVPSPPFTMVVGDDFEQASGLAFEQAVRMAVRIPGSHLHVAHVMRADAGEAETKRLSSRLRLYVSEKCAADAYAGQYLGIHVRQGDPACELAELARDVRADLIVVGARRHGHLRELLHGFFGARLRRISPCPVLVAEPMVEDAAAPDPAIEPPCPDCLVVRERSAGTQWWCARHDSRSRRLHRYSYQSELPFSSHDS
jgi:nucleotide-binding universal stress UspA family protein